MRIMHYKKGIIFFSTLLISTLAVAVAPAWKIVPEKSHLNFTATQNGAPVTGEFKKFTGDINFDPNQLASSQVTITVDMGSVSDTYNKLSDTLKSTEWFDVKSFPHAVFKSTEFVKTGDKKYQAKGTLTLRDKTIPITLDLNLDEYTATQAKMTGSTHLQRTALGVGQGEWTDTKLIKDDVEIHFVVEAVKK